MRKLKSLIAVAAILVMPLTLSGSVSAEVDCTISNTGPGSNNTCTVNTNYSCAIENENDIVIRDENDQVVGSGSADTSGNTSGGNATSGSASNSNGTTYEVVIENGECAVTNVTTPVTPTPVQPVGGMGAAGAVAEVAKPTVLAKTSGENIAAIVAATVVALGLATAGVRSYTVLQSRK